jgi:Secretion system C-terminal sorting domain
MKLYSFIFLLLFQGITSIAQSKTDSLPKEVIDRFPAAKPQLKIFPNPIQHRAELEVRYFDAGVATVQIFNNAGNIVYEARRLITGSLDRIVLMLQLPAGIYVCIVQQKQKKVKARMMVE